MVETELTGVDDIVARMRRLSNVIRKEVAVKAMRRATRIVTRAARQNALQVDDAETGRKISQNVQQRFASKTYQATGDVMYRVGVATPKGRIPKGNPDEGPKGPTPHWHLIELGTEHAQAEPFMLPALESNVGAVIDEFTAEMAAGLDKVTL